MTDIPDFSLHRRRTSVQIIQEPCYQGIFPNGSDRPAIHPVVRHRKRQLGRHEFPIAAASWKWIQSLLELPPARTIPLREQFSFILLQFQPLVRHSLLRLVQT